jgi:hypothetical protein
MYYTWWLTHLIKGGEVGEVVVLFSTDQMLSLL